VVTKKVSSNREISRSVPKSNAHPMLFRTSPAHLISRAMAGDARAQSHAKYSSRPPFPVNHATDGTIGIHRRRHLRSWNATDVPDRPRTAEALPGRPNECSGISPPRSMNDPRARHQFWGLHHRRGDVGNFGQNRARGLHRLGAHINLAYAWGAEKIPGHHRADTRGLTRISTAGWSPASR